MIPLPAQNGVRWTVIIGKKVSPARRSVEGTEMLTVGLKVVDETKAKKVEVKRAAAAAWTLTIVDSWLVGRVGVEKFVFSVM